MRLSTKGRYAVTAMMDLAIHQGRGPVTLADISHVQGISLSYLEQLFARLRKGGLVEGVRGPGGGYRLARPASEITVAEIIRAVDEKIELDRDVDSVAQQGQQFLSQGLWMELSRKLHDFLDSITLAEFADRQEVQELAQQQDLRFGRGNTPASPGADKRDVA